MNAHPFYLKLRGKFSDEVTLVKSLSLCTLHYLHFTDTENDTGLLCKELSNLQRKHAKALYKPAPIAEGRQCTV